MRYLTILLLLFCTTASACESYEECIGYADSIKPFDCTVLFEGKPTDIKCQELVSNNGSYKEATYFYTKAIAYKLDEISKKLSHSSNPMQDMIEKSLNKKAK